MFNKEVPHNQELVDALEQPQNQTMMQVIETDQSGALGYGATVDNVRIQGRWDERDENKSINFKELY